MVHAKLYEIKKWREISSDFSLTIFVCSISLLSHDSALILSRAPPRSLLSLITSCKFFPAAQACGISFSKIGCFADKHRPFPKLLITQRNSIDWKSWNKFLERQVLIDAESQKRGERVNVPLYWPHSRPQSHDPSDLRQGSRALAGPDFLSMCRVFVSYSQPIRFAIFDGKSVNRGLPVLDKARALDPCSRSEGSWFWGRECIDRFAFFVSFINKNTLDRRLNCSNS